MCIYSQEQNTAVLAQWLDAKYYESKYIPIPIKEYLVCDNSAYAIATSSGFFRTTNQLTSSNLVYVRKPDREIEPSSHIELSKPVLNSVVALALETFEAGYGVLVFCSSRAGCQRTASLICGALPKREQLDSSTLHGRTEVLSSLRSIVDIDDALARNVMQGVAFHRKLYSMFLLDSSGF